MANTYTQIHLHLVFTVQNRISLIKKEWQQDLYKYIITIIQKHGHKVLVIGGMPDHIHILIGFRPTQALKDLMQEIKRDSSEWINKSGYAMGKFTWQDGYGAFSYGKSQLKDIIKYIENQEIHHKGRSFIEEYKIILDKFGVEYDDRYIFKTIDW